MNPEEKHGLTTFHYQTEDGEMVELDATVTEIKVEPSYDLMGVDWGRPEGSITGTFTSNIRKLSPTLTRYFKRVSGLGYVYVDDINNLL